MDRQSYNEMKKVKEEYFSKLEYRAPTVYIVFSNRL